MKARIIQLLIIASVFVGCEHDIPTYSGGAGIYFEGKQMSDTVGFSWAYCSNELRDTNITVRVQTIGEPKDYDRAVKLLPVDHPKADEQAKENIDYKPFSYDIVIPAGQSFFDLTIDLIRNPGLLTGVPKIFSFRLEENEHFKFHYNRVYEIQKVDENGETIKTYKHIDTYRSFKISEKIGQQGWWKGQSSVGIRNLGTWSVKKSVLICDLMEIDRQAWLSGNLVAPTTTAYIKFLGRYMHRWLQDNPTYEEDGITLMEMGEDARK